MDGITYNVWSFVSSLFQLAQCFGGFIPKNVVAGMSILFIFLDG